MAITLVTVIVSIFEETTFLSTFQKPVLLPLFVIFYKVLLLE